MNQEKSDNNSVVVPFPEQPETDHSQEESLRVPGDVVDLHVVYEDPSLERLEASKRNHPASKS